MNKNNLNKSKVSVKEEDQKKEGKESIRQHWENIDKIKKENSALKQEIETEIRYSNLNDAQQQQKMEKLQEEGSVYAKKIEIETQRNKELQKQIELIQYNLQEKKRVINSQDGNEINNLQKKVKTLEYRLEKTRQRHNEALAEIRRLKEEVNAARRERVIFDNVFKKLETDLKLKEEELKKCIFETLQIETQRDQASDDLARIKKQSEAELKQFQKEYENAFKIENDLPNDTNILQTSNILQLDDSRINDKSNMKNLKDVNSEQLIDNSTNEIQQYELIFEKLKVEAGVQDIDEFIKVFNSQEQVNQDLFTQSNQLNDEIENYEKKIQSMDKEIQKFDNRKQTEDQVGQTKSIEDLRQRVIEAQERNNKIEESNITMQTELEQLINDIPEIFESLGCKTFENETTVKKEQITTGNMITYLAIIEKRANEIIDLYNYLQKKESNQDNTQQIVDQSFASQNSSQQPQKKQNEQKQKVTDLLSGIEKVKECEKILSQNDFRDISNKEIQKFSYKPQVSKRHNQ